MKNDFLFGALVRLSAHSSLLQPGNGTHSGGFCCRLLVAAIPAGRTSFAIRCNPGAGMASHTANAGSLREGLGHSFLSTFVWLARIIIIFSMFYVEKFRTRKPGIYVLFSSSKINFHGKCLPLSHVENRHAYPYHTGNPPGFRKQIRI